MVFSMFQENLPCYYDMYSEGLNLILEVHKDFARKMPIDGKRIEEMKIRFGLDNFSDFSGNFGYDGAFQRKGCQCNLIKFAIPISTASDLNGPWKSLKRTVMSMAFFFDMARYSYREKVACGRQQLLTMLIVVDDNDWQSSVLMGDFSPALCYWIEERMDNGDLLLIEGAMRQTYQHILGRGGGTFRAHATKEGGLVLECPNDARLNVFSIHGEGPNRYMEFGSGRLNSVSSLMALTSGLFALNGAARKDGAGSF